MTQGNGTAIDIHLTGVQLQVLQHSQGLGGEGFVELVQIHFLALPVDLR